MRLMSFCWMAMRAAPTAVVMPMNAMTDCAAGDAWTRQKTRESMYTPAATMVAAWMRAETGVGPSMASGSQTWRGNWADLPTAPQKMRMVATARKPGFAARVGTAALRSEK